MQTTATYRKNKLSAWLIVLSLLLSSFCFTGYSGQISAHYQHAIQTAWKYAGNNTSAKHAVSYKNLVQSFAKKSCITKTAIYKFAQAAYQSVVQTRLVRSREISSVIPSFQRSVLLQMLARNGTEAASFFATE